MGYSRIMRLILFFDLPMITKKNVRDYNRFRKGITKMGFYMLQESVYVKMVIDRQAKESSVNKISNMLPPEGNIIVLTVTEKQFSSMSIMLGDAQTDVLTSIDRIVII